MCPTDEMSSESHRNGSAVTGFLIVTGFVLGYFAIQLWLLPAMGVPT